MATRSEGAAGAFPEDGPDEDPTSEDDPVTAEDEPDLDDEAPRLLEDAAETPADEDEPREVDALMLVLARDDARAEVDEGPAEVATDVEEAARLESAGRLVLPAAEEGGADVLPA